MSKETDQFTDADYIKWVKRLDTEEFKNGKELTDWEVGFVQQGLRQSRFTDSQRRIILDMVEAYL